jgi:hypothetical protein
MLLVLPAEQAAAHTKLDKMTSLVVEMDPATCIRVLRRPLALRATIPVVMGLVVGNALQLQRVSRMRLVDGVLPVLVLSGEVSHRCIFFLLK